MFFLTKMAIYRLVTQIMTEFKNILDAMNLYNANDTLLLPYGMKVLLNIQKLGPPPLNFIIFTNYCLIFGLTLMLITKKILLIVSLCSWYLKTWV